MTPNHQQSEATSSSFIQGWLQVQGPHQRREFLRTHRSEITDETVQAMKTTVSQRLRQDPRDAFELAESILFAADLSGQPMHLAWGLMANGNVQRYQARYEEAIATYDRAQSICLTQNNPVEAARPQMAKVGALAYLSRFEEALQDAEEARRIFEAHGKIAETAIVDYQAGVAAYKMGDYNRALALFDRARLGFEKAGATSRPDYIYVELNRSVALRNLDRIAEAQLAAERARQLATQHDMRVVAARAEQSLAITHFFMGEYNQALKLFDQARSVFDTSDLRRDVLVANLFATNCHLALNRYAEVLDLAQEAERELAQLGMHYEVGWAAYNCAQAYLGMGQVEAAADALAVARLVFAQIENQVWVATVDIQWANLNLRIGALEAALANAQRAGGVFTSQGLAVEGAQAHLAAAEALLALERDKLVGQLCQSVLQTAEDRDVPWLANRAHHLLGRLAEIGGDQAAALSYYKKCAAGIERLRGQVAVELRSGFLADKGEIYEDLVSLHLANGATQQAFEYVERAKSRALIELLAQELDIRVKVRRESDRDLVAHIERLRQECQWYYNRFKPFGERESAESGLSQAEQDRLRTELHNREKQLTDMLVQLQVRNADYTQDNDLWRVRAESPQPYLDADTLLLEYFIARGEVLAFSISQHEIRVHRHLASTSRLTRLLSLLQLNLHRLSPALLARGDSVVNEWTNLQGLLNRLYAALIHPLQPVLAEFQKLVIVPHGPLHYLPFHALYGGQDYLLEQFEVSYLPNSSLLRLCCDGKADGHPAQGALIVGYSLDGALPYVLTEAQQVADRLSGTSLIEGEATRSNLEDLARHAHLIHLATHGEFRQDSPLFSTLYLADGPLTATDVFNLDLNATLITLSACQSGVSVVGGGDELVGFSRAFLYAGADSLLMTLWRVTDHSTARLMDHFYQALLDGQRKPAALRQAQLAALRGEEGERYRHPYFWAPFFLVGDRSQIM